MICLSVSFSFLSTESQFINFLAIILRLQQFDPFQRGFQRVCGGPALALFSPDELELLVCGRCVLQKPLIYTQALDNHPLALIYLSDTHTHRRHTHAHTHARTHTHTHTHTHTRTHAHTHTLSLTRSPAHIAVIQTPSHSLQPSVGLCGA